MKNFIIWIQTASFIINVKADDNYKDITKGVETRFGTSNFEINTPLPRGKNKEIIGPPKDELGGQIMKEFVWLRPKTYSSLKDNNAENKKTTATKKCVIKRKLKFQVYKNCLKAAQINLKR